MGTAKLTAQLSDRMIKPAEKPLFHVSVSDRDDWLVEVEWPDGTLERVRTFKNHFGSGPLDSHGIQSMVACSRGSKRSARS
jgi:hypothetical protein